MEQLNRIELKGLVGNVKITKVGDDGRRIANFGLATNYVYKSADGVPVIETTWHSVTAIEGGKCIDFDSIAKGSPVHVIGRLKSERYTDTDNNTNVYFRVIASEVKAVTD